MAKRTSKQIDDIDPNLALAEYAETFPSTAPKPKAKKKIKKGEDDVTVTLRLPPYIHKQLKIKAVTEDKTQRELILEGLRLVGLEIEDEDIVDRRKGEH